MIVAMLQGGLGNQMFQYAAGRALAVRHRTALRLDTRSYRRDRKRRYALDQFRIRADVLSPRATLWLRARRRLASRLGVSGRLAFVNEIDGAPHPAFHELPDHTCLDGHWQHEHYFSAIADELRAELQPRIALPASGAALRDHIEGSLSVTVHVRRGDYLEPRERAFHGLLDSAYYARGVATLRDKLGSQATFFVFSDDPAGAKTVVPLDRGVVWVERGEGRSDGADLFLMSRCRHHLVANSSFSWWGAWLNEDPRTITIAPRNWYADPARAERHPAPERWLRI